MDNADSKDTPVNVPGEKVLSVGVVEQTADIRDVTTQEHELGFFQALQLHPTSVFWSIALSTTVIMEGFDTALMGSLFGQPAFQKAYGNQVKPGSYQLSAPWQAGLSNSSTSGQLLGLLLAGYVSERFGFRKTMISGLVVISATLFITFFAPSLPVLLVGQILSGIPLGMFQTTAVIYALEITPFSLRPYLTNYVNFCWSFGKIIAVGILRGVLPLENHWAYRIPFAVQWVWPVIMIPIIYLAPESPWWLVRRGRIQQAKATLERLTPAWNTDFDIDKNVSSMIFTTEYERTIQAETSYYACFRNTNLLRTVIVIGIYCIQTLSGNPLRGYSTYFFEQAGLSPTQSFNMSIANLAVAIAGGFFSWVLLPLFGRRMIYLSNLVLMFVILTLVGALGVPQATAHNPAYAWGIGALLLISSFTYDCSIGPLTNTLCSEIPSALLRSKSIALARWTYAVTTLVAGVLTPYQLNPTAWNWGARTGFFWAGACLLSIVFTYFLVPETKGRTTVELDILFEKGTAIQKFHKTDIDLTSHFRGNDEKALEA